MKKYLFFLLLIFPILLFGQKPYKIKKEEGNGLILLNQAGTIVDTLQRISSNKTVSFFQLEERLFMIDEIFTGNSKSFIIKELNVSNDKFTLKRSVPMNMKGCLSSQDLDTFKIKVKKEKICWKFRRKGKKYKRAFSLKEFEEQQTLKLPQNVCNKNPFSGY